MKQYNDDKIEVSVICNTYNHQAFIETALEGFVKQKTNFKFEVLVHDDASTDNTAQIIKKYEKKYPSIIKPIYQTDNQYSRGISITKTFQLPRAKGQYIAFCEGDDYWIDTSKLQRQFDALNSNPKIDMCAHIVSEIDASTGELVRKIAPSNTTRTLSLKEVISGGGDYLGSCSLFYRKVIEEHPPEFREIFSLDYTLQVNGALKGGILFIAKDMGVYRGQTPNSWTDQIHKNAKKNADHKRRLRKVLKLMDKETNYLYHSLFLKREAYNFIKESILRLIAIIQ